MKRPFTTYTLALFLLILAACQNAETQPTAVQTVQPAATDTAEATAPEPTFQPPPTIEVSPTAESTPMVESVAFDGESAYDYLLAQMDFGARWPGSPGHAELGDYIAEQLSGLNWEVQEQLFPYQDITGRNIIGKANIGAGPVIILGAHYDTRKVADQTPGNDGPDPAPVPGANDGASGVAVLLELARTLDLDKIDHEIWLAFFDVEDNGNNGIPGFDWIIGSTYMAENLTIEPEAMVLADMIGDADQQLYLEQNSDAELQTTIWEIAAELGYASNFIQDYKYTMIDDHLPFARQGIPSVDIIDFDYPYWHTVEDTANKVSPDSLLRVGRTLEVWLEMDIDG
ncbi:MAG: M28 family peptidase [Candidatus Promineifilaceae bacterium]